MTLYWLILYCYKGHATFCGIRNKNWLYSVARQDLLFQTAAQRDPCTSSVLATLWRIEYHFLWGPMVAVKVEMEWLILEIQAIALCFITVL